MNGFTIRKFNSILIAFVLVTVLLHYGRPFLVPLTFAVFFAMLMTPVSNKIEQWGSGRVFSTVTSLLILIIAFSGILYLVSLQARNMSRDLPKMEKRTQELVDSSIDYIEEKFDIPEVTQRKFITKQVQSLLKSSGNVIKNFLSGFTNILVGMAMVLFCMFLLLLQREKYETFFMKLSGDNIVEPSRQTILKISRVAQHYLAGRMLSVLIFTVLFTIGMMIVGVKNAFFLSLIAALMTIVPYIGSIIGGIFPFAVALVSDDSLSVAFGALAVILIVQGFDNYFIEPYIIGGEVNISPIATILALFAGGLIWGAAGMILFIPMVGVLKIIFDNVNGLEPYGFLIGDQSTSRQSTRILNWFKNLKGTESSSK